MATNTKKPTEAIEEAAAIEATEATETEAAPAIEDDGREDIFIPKGYVNDEPNLFVSVNGVNYLLPKGKTSRVPKHVAAEIRRSWKAQAAMDERVDAMLEATKNPVAT